MAVDEAPRGLPTALRQLLRRLFTPRYPTVVISAAVLCPFLGRKAGSILRRHGRAGICGAWWPRPNRPQPRLKPVCAEGAGVASPLGPAVHPDGGYRLADARRALGPKTLAINWLSRDGDIAPICRPSSSPSGEMKNVVGNPYTP